MKKPFANFTGKAWLTAVAIILFIAACKKSNDNNSSQSSTIADIVSTNSSFSTLNAAVIKAGLGTTLSGSGPFTVFAPDNDAFNASGISTTIIGTLPDTVIKKILLYHTLTAKVPAASVPARPNAGVATAAGDSIYVTNNSSGVFVNGIKVKQADVNASNGIVHVLNAVLIPPVGNIVQTAQADTTFSYLVAAVVRASAGATDVASVLSGKGPFTVFAPTNNAFRAAGFATINAINNADPDVLASILVYHVIAGRIFSSDLSEGAQPTTLSGGKVTISLAGGPSVKGNNNTQPSKIAPANIVATNGVIHVIDSVLLP
ncbi:MAG: fasciclin domain-containing protein [Bacteroidetes bacterium]|nr:fasciclin domain-containing protein [Bacteroidota bacterium]